MADIGPVTVLAIGIGGSEGWGAYSCDPDRKCLPVKVGAPNKWGKRIAERIARACAESTTLWFPADKRACADAPAPAGAAVARRRHRPQQPPHRLPPNTRLTSASSAGRLRRPELIAGGSEPFEGSD